MIPLRPLVSALAPVRNDGLVFRFVQPGHINEAAVLGARLQTAVLQTNEFTPNEKSYCASVYVKSLLSRGLEDLYDADAKWRTWRVSEVPIEEVVSLGVQVVLSPQDCELVNIRHAHASLIGVDKHKRNKLVRLIEQYLL
jgi:hypothetical protein